MGYEDFTILDTIICGLGTMFDKPTRDIIKKTGITDKQLDTCGPILIYSLAKNILYDYINGKKNYFNYDLYPYAVFSLKQFILVLQDNDIKNKTSIFLKHPSIENAQDVIDELSKSEQKYFSQEAIDNFYKDKPIMGNMNDN